MKTWETTVIFLNLWNLFIHRNMGLANYILRGMKKVALLLLIMCHIHWFFSIHWSYSLSISLCVGISWSIFLSLTLPLYLQLLSFLANLPLKYCKLSLWPKLKLNNISVNLFIEPINCNHTITAPWRIKFNLKSVYYKPAV